MHRRGLEEGRQRVVARLRHPLPGGGNPEVDVRRPAGVGGADREELSGWPVGRVLRGFLLTRHLAKLDS